MDIRFVTLSNATDTAEQAPYTGRIIPNGVANLNDLIREISDTITMTDARARLILGAAIEAAVERCKKGETVKFGCVTMKPRIENSFSYVDEPYDPLTNRVIIECYLGDELAGVLDEVVPVRVKAEEMADNIKFSNVLDVDSQIFGVINGTASFQLLGNGITVDTAGEYVRLVDPKTGATLVEAEVDTVAKGQRATCHFPASNVASGKYKVELGTYGLIGDTKLHVFAKNVVYTASEPPTPPTPTLTDVELSATFDESTGSGKLYGKVTGTNFHAKQSGNTMTVVVTDTFDEYQIEDWEVNDDGTEITFERDMGNDVVGSNAKFIANIGATLEKEGIVIAAHE